MTEAPLTGWKEVAAFLGSSVRTVQRFERELGLPIHRTQLSKGAVVRAYPSELTRWLDDRRTAAPSEELSRNSDGRTDRQPGSRMPRVLTFAAVGLLLLLVGAWRWHSSGVSESQAPRDAHAAGNLGRANTLAVGNQPRRVSLTIRPSPPSLGSPVRVSGPEGGQIDMNLGPGLDLTLRPTLQGHELVLDVDRRLPSADGVQRADTIRLAAGATERLEVSGVKFEITWNAAQPPVPH
jgi:hypothetical protein